MTREAIRPLFEALAGLVEPSTLKAEMRAYLGDAGNAEPEPARAPAGGSSARFLLQDILDDSILGAKAGDKSFPLRVLFSELATRAEGETAFTLLCALNVYFRIDADDEVKMRLGVEASRLFYAFMEEARPEGLAPAQVSGLLASLLSTGLSRVRLEAVDHAGSFDSSAHERGHGADAASGTLRRPLSFLCRVTQSGMIRIKAAVLT